MNLPNKLAKKVIKGWFVVFIDYNGQSADFHTRLLRHVRGNQNFLGEDRQVYYFQFETAEKSEAFLNIINKSFQEKNIKTK